MSSEPADLESRLSAALERIAPGGLVSAYLFGSHAAARAHRESDVDVAVLLDRRAYPDARARFGERVRLATALIAELHTHRVDVVVLNDAPPGLGRRIVTAGRRLLCRDPGADHTFVRDVQLRAADLEPFLRRARRVTLAALAR
jgi:predicted nucleotidyltransferase